MNVDARMSDWTQRCDQIRSFDAGYEIMTFTVKVTYQDGSATRIDRLFPDVASASLFALQLADDIGLTFTINGAKAATPRAVVIAEARAIILEIKIFAGGLYPRLASSGVIDLPRPAESSGL